MKPFIDWNEFLFLGLKMAVIVASSVFLYESGLKKSFAGKSEYYIAALKHVFASLVATLFLFTIIGELNDNVTMIAVIIPLYAFCYMRGSFKKQTA